MIDIYFIINPIAGSGKNLCSEKFLEKYFDAKRYAIHLKVSEFKKHAIALTKEAVEKEAQIIVACGGDGTINEVATALVGTHIPLGIIPMGSGNGLASNLKIPRGIEEAIKIILKNERIVIDVGRVNEHYFFSNIGFGFDASVIKNYEIAARRSLFAYIKASLKSFHDYHKQEEMLIEINGTNQVIHPFLIFISNSNVMGYGMSLTPKASLQDGVFDVVLVPKLPKWKMLIFGLLMLLKKPELLKEVHCYQAKKIHLLRKNGACFQAQIDGELVHILDFSVNITLKESSLSVLV